jgi:aspartate-semialdehyde dehydrogenase
MRVGDRKLRVGVLGATGMVGQRFVALLESHPWFELSLVAASPASAGRPYAEAVRDRWALASPVPAGDRERLVVDAADVERVAGEVDFVFCAVDLPKAETAALEERYARAEVPVVSNNSAHRSTPDVPMLVPEVNPEHAAVIEPQRRRLGTRRGFVAVKPNCSLQSYVPALHPLRRWGIERVVVSTYQAVSGAGKTLASWPDMVDNVIPFISGEEEKSELEPRKLWGSIEGGGVVPAASPVISAQCVRVPVSDGHLATVWASFDKAPAHDEILAAWAGFRTRPEELALPSAPSPFLTYFDEPSRPQTRLDRELGGGMGVALGRLRADSLHDVRFVALSHNTVRGAAGGAVLMAELLVAEGYLTRG